MGVSLENCPTSNMQTSVEGLKSDLSNYPTGKFLEKGIK